jgi:hypothetical protein
MSVAHPLVDLFRSPGVNRLSEFASFAAGIRTADIAAWYSIELANAPKRHSRGKTYFSNGHTGRPRSGSASNRSEEHLAIALWSSFRTSGVTLPNGDEMVLVDYQVPLRASQLDSGIGKMDLFGVVEGPSSSYTGRVCELKTLGCDTPLKALLECLAYHAIAAVNLADFSAELGKCFRNLECMILAPVNYWHNFAGRRSAGNWAGEIRSLAKRVETDLGFKFSFLALENCQWSMGLNGTAPVLSCEPKVHNAI